MRTAEHYALNPFSHCNSRVTRVLGRHLGGSEDAPQSGAAARLFLISSAGEPLDTAFQRCPGPSSAVEDLCHFRRELGREK